MESLMTCGPQLRVFFKEEGEGITMNQYVIRA